MVIKYRLSLFFLIVVSAFLAVLFNQKQAVNPDPNHTHADFAVWVDGTQLDFTGEEFMSGTSDETDPNHTKHDPYLHLHDANGHVIHRHKPGLHLSDFFATIGFGASSGLPEGGMCLVDDSRDGPCLSGRMRLFVNGKEVVTDSPFDFVFQDIDQILLTDSTDQAEVDRELQKLTDDACLYSKTCPWRGEPPAENCIADPTVPCVVQ